MATNIPMGEAGANSLIYIGAITEEQPSETSYNQRYGHSNLTTFESVSTFLKINPIQQLGEKCRQRLRKTVFRIGFPKNSGIKPVHGSFKIVSLFSFCFIFRGIMRLEAFS